MALEEKNAPRGTTQETEKKKSMAILYIYLLPTLDTNRIGKGGL